MTFGPELSLIDDAVVGVLGFTARDLTPRAVAVTPYVIDGKPTVTTTLALLTKAKMLRARPAAALLAGGVHVSADTTLEMHQDSEWFDANLRAAEARKYPPARSLLSIPFHRRLLWWYLGRVVITFDSATITTPGVGDRVTITSVVDGEIVITPLADQLSTDTENIELGTEVPDGAGCLLVHHETDNMDELLALTLRGEVREGVLAVKSRHGSILPQNPGTLTQIRSLFTLGRAARANRDLIDNWSAGTTAT
ncbi:MAG: hypothetical protein GY708_04165 [Actinomycetia bacterium]|nr:hypothetical protein [Actinomycetes bacterium]